MPGLLEDSVSQGATAFRGLEDAANQSAEHFLQDFERKQSVEQGVGTLVGTYLGQKLGQKRGLATSQDGGGSTGGTASSADNTAAAATPASPDSAAGSTDGNSMLMGTLGKRMSGGFLNNVAPPLFTSKDYSFNSLPYLAEGE
jgi:hypothetical protein